ncbi:sox-1 protein [Moniliophthora roreri MCA 2997]|uniref:Sox-1 protein n=2 Tax=Moniliophthora roreri TaxID=221103 RepID=V2XA37_MONRO|nr:sox-1 protein [Moniliophthora roreri MCA 2997]KAI3601157.1 sox-1 protein [Moniliophthora roreri]
MKSFDPYPTSQSNGTSTDDRSSSHSPSDGDSSSSYNPLYGDGLNTKLEGDLDDDGSTALTSQTLNADGTPKRPMNAFMIFARRRRPQVSSENTSMRTGEISKILSKEWNAMPPSEKQFYLDQAKQLKDTFNSKYPDYVYRRRPNNSRRRRRHDPTSTQSLNPSTTENGDRDDVGESSPTATYGGAHDIDTSHTHKYPSTSSDLQSRSTLAFGNAGFPDLPSFGRPHDAGNRLPFLDQQRSTLPSPRLTVPPQNHNPIYSTTSHNSAWDTKAWADRSLPPATLPPPHSHSQQQHHQHHHHHRNSFSSSASNSSWSPTGSHPPSSAPGTESGSFPFPTLNSPFYPPPPNTSHSAYSGSASPAPHDAERPYSSHSHNSHRNSYPSPSPSLRDFPSQPPSRGGDLPRSLPALHSITSFTGAGIGGIGAHSGTSTPLVADLGGVGDSYSWARGGP